MTRLAEDEIATRLDSLVGWQLKEGMLVKTYKLPSFPSAIAFVTHVGFIAEAAGHHPDINIRYNKVTLALTTHDAGGITSKDFDLAVAADEVMG